MERSICWSGQRGWPLPVAFGEIITINAGRVAYRMPPVLDDGGTDLVATFS